MVINERAVLFPFLSIQSFTSCLMGRSDSGNAMVLRASNRVPLIGGGEDRSSCSLSIVATAVEMIWKTSTVNRSGESPRSRTSHRISVWLPLNAEKSVLTTFPELSVTISMVRVISGSVCPCGMQTKKQVTIPTQARLFRVFPNSHLALPQLLLAGIRFFNPSVLSPPLEQGWREFRGWKGEFARISGILRRNS